MPSKVHIDIETCSEIDLKKCGTHVYAEHRSTILLCVAYAIDDGPVQVWRTIEDPSLPMDLLGAFLDPLCEVHAWNAGGFEMVVLRELFKRTKFHMVPVPFNNRWRDTMIRAAYWGLPMKLEHAAEALHSQYKKDMSGHRLMLQMSRPKKDGAYWHKTDPAKYDRLCDYCKQDVEVEREIANQLPPLPAEEQQQWELDFNMMHRGVPVDTNAVFAMRAVAVRELARLDDDMRTVTKGAVQSVNSVGALLNFCHSKMASVSIPGSIAAAMLPSTAKEDVAAFLSELEPSRHNNLVFHRGRGLNFGADIARALFIRQEAAKSSTAKLVAMLNSTNSRGTISGLTQFYGASRTGRWAGRLVQVQNLPRPAKGIDVDDEIEGFLNFGARGYSAPKGYSPLDVISSCLRGCFKSPDGPFIVGDYGQIEARVVAWLAGQDDILEVFARGDDVYTYTANKQGSKDRQFGKVLVLACGFGMGWKKFQDTAKTYGITLDDSTAQNAVADWRKSNPKIVQFWKGLENAARAVIDGKTKGVATVGKIKMAMGERKTRDCFLVRLPSGRDLVYRNPRLIDGEDGWPPKIVYDGVNQTTRKWGAVDTYGGKLCENIVQAVARDLLAHACLHLESGHILMPLVTIHDEVVTLPKAPSAAGPATHAQYLKGMMELRPRWASDLPLAAEVKAMVRYGK